MKRELSLMKLLNVVLFTIVLSAPAVAMSAGFGNYSVQQPEVTQTFTLHPGWNAIYLEVEPSLSAPATVFSGLPVESVWAWLEYDEPAEFIQDVTEASWEKSGWSRWFSAASDAPLNNLYAIQENKAYLINVSGSVSITWNVTGRPSLRETSWKADSLNLVGFRVDPSVSISFADYFSPSAAHNGEAIYRLSGVGRWEFIDSPSAVNINSGEAYWVYSEGGSDYQGPLQVSESGGSDGLDYSDVIDTLTLELLNNDSVERTVMIEKLSSSKPVHIEYRYFNTASQKTIWQPLDSGSITKTVEAGSKSDVVLGVRRSSFNGEAGTVLKVTDGAGVRVYVPVSAIGQ